jgi:hypothetical protein
MRWGGQTVTFVSITEDPDNRDRYNTPVRVRTQTDVAGCRFRPLVAKEKLVDVSAQLVTDPQQITAPPAAAVVGLLPTDEVIYDGVTYVPVGPPRVFTDTRGRDYKVTLIVQRSTG